MFGRKICFLIQALRGPRRTLDHWRLLQFEKSWKKPAPTTSHLCRSKSSACGVRILASLKLIFNTNVFFTYTSVSISAI